LSAVMRCFMLEHEIALRQHSIDFVGGTSMLLRRYCRPVEAASYAFVWKPGLRATFTRTVVPRIKAQSVYERFGALQSPRGTDSEQARAALAPSASLPTEQVRKRQ
jgi:hypothetical protein